MAEPTLLPERLQYRPTKIELDESIEKAKATLLKKIKRPSLTSSVLASRSCLRPVTPTCCCTPVP